MICSSLGFIKFNRNYFTVFEARNPAFAKQLGYAVFLFIRIVLVMFWLLGTFFCCQEVL